MKTKAGTINSKHITMAILFTVYMSEYMLCLICMDQSAYHLEGTGAILHYLKMPALAVGFLLFPLSQKFESDIRTRRITMLASDIIFIAGMAGIMELFIKTGPVGYIISCTVTLISLGFLGGAVYYYYAMGHVGHAYIGRLSGIAGAAAFLIQMTVQFLIPSNIAMLVLLLAGFAFTTYLTIVSKKRFEWMFDEPLEYARRGDPALPGKMIIVAGCAAMIMLYMINGLTDTIIISLSFSGDMSMYAWPRLFGAAGYLVGGFLADLGRRKWLMVCALCMSIMSFPLPFMLQEGHVITATCHYYVIVVSQIVFLNVFFWDLAPKTSHPQLVAGLSRVLACVCDAIHPAFSNTSVMTRITIEALLTSAVLLCIVLGGYIPVPYHKKQVNAPDGSKLDEFAAAHGLTPREKDFLICLIESDDDVSVIASNMNTSTRTVYRHINSIYEKTGTETRYSLMRYYYQSH
ncbi:MAG: helix-turn-helix transcriptional regulator [Lachnospiraceae bacterium]|nr:helix-turn-helix transcriptional regulator [Lachnospiraceae bacterium]